VDQNLLSPSGVIRNAAALPQQFAFSLGRAVIWTDTDFDSARKVPEDSGLLELYWLYKSALNQAKLLLI